MNQHINQVDYTALTCGSVFPLFFIWKTKYISHFATNLIYTTGTMFKLIFEQRINHSSTKTFGFVVFETDNTARQIYVCILWVLYPRRKSRKRDGNYSKIYGQRIQKHKKCRRMIFRLWRFRAEKPSYQVNEVFAF